MIIVWGILALVNLLFFMSTGYFICLLAIMGCAVAIRLEARGGRHARTSLW
jgi:hypothetical protein